MLILFSQFKNCPWADRTLILEHYKTPHYPHQGGSHGLQGISPLWPPLPSKAIKAAHFCFSQNSVCFYLAPETESRTLATTERPKSGLRLLPQLSQECVGHADCRRTHEQEPSTALHCPESEGPAAASGRLVSGHQLLPPPPREQARAESRHELLPLLFWSMQATGATSRHGNKCWSLALLSWEWVGCCCYWKAWEQKPIAAATVLGMHKLPLLLRDSQVGSNSCLSWTESAHGPPHLHTPYQGANGQHTEERGSKHPN